MEKYKIKVLAEKHNINIDIVKDIVEEAEYNFDKLLKPLDENKTSK